LTLTVQLLNMPLGQQVDGHWEGEDLEALWGWISSKIA
jgi:hypothetical protein